MLVLFGSEDVASRSVKSPRETALKGPLRPFLRAFCVRLREEQKKVALWSLWWITLFYLELSSARARLSASVSALFRIDRMQFPVLTVLNLLRHGIRYIMFQLVHPGIAYQSINIFTLKLFLIIKDIIFIY